jgi:hypothetical protein
MITLEEHTSFKKTLCLLVSISQRLLLAKYFFRYFFNYIHVRFPTEIYQQLKMCILASSAPLFMWKLSFCEIVNDQNHLFGLGPKPILSAVVLRRPGYIYLFGGNKNGNSSDSLKILGKVRKFRAVRMKTSLVFPNLFGVKVKGLKTN